MSRDALGRRVPPGSPLAVPDVPERALPPAEALALAQALLDEGRAFGAHEVLEAVWKACPPQERDLWQGLAQLCVGVCHVQRGNAVGGARLLRRGAGNLPEALPHGLEHGLRAQALAAAERVEAGATGAPALRLRGAG